MFNELREGSPLYILRKGDKKNAPTLRIAYVTKKSNPLTAAGTPALNYGPPTESFVDIEAKADNEEYNFGKLRSSDSTRFYPNENTFISDSREQVIQEFENMYRMSMQTLETMSYHQGVADAYEEIMCQLNPQLAKEREQGEKIGALEHKITGIESTLTSIQDMLSKALDNGGSKKSNDK